MGSSANCLREEKCVELLHGELARKIPPAVMCAAGPGRQPAESNGEGVRPFRARDSSAPGSTWDGGTQRAQPPVVPRPTPFVPSENGGLLTSWDLSGFHVSAERRGAGGGAKGGDFYTLAVRAPGRIGVLIGDACGRGADGEKQLARILPKVRELALSGLSPARLLSELNKTAFARLALDRFVTAAAFELDAKRGALAVANAGHVPALVHRAGQVSVVGCVSGAPLGFSAETTYTEEHHRLLQGDVIVLMTDGVLEAIEADLTTMSTLRSLFAQSAEGARGVHALLLRKFEECTRGRCADDMTLVALEALSEASTSNTNHYARAS